MMSAVGGKGAERSRARGQSGLRKGLKAPQGKSRYNQWKNRAILNDLGVNKQLQYVKLLASDAWLCFK